jgi:(S)-2-hydroxyglutarate dehydrogenase
VVEYKNPFRRSARLVNLFGVSVIVVGGGLVGLATAYQLLRRGATPSVTILEKELTLGAHQSTHNSGVLHSGLHYAPGSTRARLAREGIRSMVEFCRDRGIAYEQCGKLVIATNDTEVGRLRALQERGAANGLVGLRWLTGTELREIEPHAAGVVALHVPEEGIVDYAAVCAALRNEIESLRGMIHTGACVRRLHRANGKWEIDCDSRTFLADTLVNCAGLHSDRVAKLAGEKINTRVVPFRGEYWTLKPERAHLVRNLIYPVPDPAFPFLGVHLTRMIRGGVEAGPNAVLALAREGYRWSHINARDLADALSFPGLWRFLARYPRVATYEIARSFSKRLFLRSIQKLVPAIQHEDLQPGPSGVRAQAMTRSGDLVQDFQIVESPGAVHVINAPSPAATAAFAIGARIVERVMRLT